MSDESTNHRNELARAMSVSNARLLASIDQIKSLRRLNRGVLPSRENVAECVDGLLQLIYPGYFGKQELSGDNLNGRVAELMGKLSVMLFDHVRFCLRYRIERPEEADFETRCEKCDEEASRVVAAFFESLPAVRERLADDVQAAFDADPAATSTDETIFCYPGVLAITVQRLSHELYRSSVPLLPRIWTELAHARTGIDIHPGAQLGKRFFIDHGTGVVIGETTVIGDNVKIYQGVTLGALAPAFGQRLRGTKRHPTIEDDVTIYAGATVLGGDTVIGAGCTLGGNVFLTSSVPAKRVVMMESPRLRIRDRARKDDGDFQI
jgi:serine O-acetyltransferase